jgi:uncharacterized protein (DUF433 family)
MTMTPVLETHIFLDEQGRACIKRAGVKVREIIESLEAYKCMPEELIRHFPYLMLSEVYAALTYYYDHRTEIDTAIREGRTLVEEMRASAPEAPATQRVREEMERRHTGREEK